MSTGITQLTSREQAVVDFLLRPWVANACLALAAAVIGTLALIPVQAACFQLPDEYRGRPQDGTPASAYCSRLDHGLKWPIFLGCAVLLAAIIGWGLRRRRHPRRWAIIVVTVAAIANSIVLIALPNYYGG